MLFLEGGPYWETAVDALNQQCAGMFDLVFQFLRDGLSVDERGHRTEITRLIGEVEIAAIVRAGPVVRRGVCGGGLVRVGRARHCGGARAAAGGRASGTGRGQGGCAVSTPTEGEALPHTKRSVGELALHGSGNAALVGEYVDISASVGGEMSTGGRGG